MLILHAPLRQIMFEYEGTLYRPPSEANSLSLQVTIGCTHNTCTFCDMYKQKTFRIRSEEEVLAELEEVAASPYRDYFRRVFFADGDALCVPTGRLLRLLKTVQGILPHMERVTAYTTASDVLHKTVDELWSLKDAGLSMVYMGVETGDDEILAYIRKNSTRQDYIDAAEKLHAAGIQNSVTLISGLGGRDNLERHALSCATLISAMKPEYASFLTLRLFPGTPMYEDLKSGAFIPLTDEEVFEEMKIFLNHVDSEGTVFRSNHASNAMPLAGTLNRDIPALRKAIEKAETSGYRRPYRLYGGL